LETCSWRRNPTADMPSMMLRDAPVANSGPAKSAYSAASRKAGAHVGHDDPSSLSD
jgi:hypothetical protein